MYQWKKTLAGGALATLAMLALASGTALAKTQVTFFYPVQVGGPLTKIVDGYVAKFEAANPDIKVVPVYSGNYLDTTTKALTAAKSGTPPTVAVLLATDIFTLIDEDAVQPIDDFVKTTNSPACAGVAARSTDIWAVPFALTAVCWNKKAFAEAGLDRSIQDRDEMVALRQAVTKGYSGRDRWGIPSGSAQWLFGALAAQNGVRLMNDAGNQTNLTNPKVVEALQFWVDLNKVHGIHPPGIQEWGTTPSDFLEERIAMIWTTTASPTSGQCEVRASLIRAVARHRCWAAAIILRAPTARRRPHEFLGSSPG
jgi:sn-glycerol 3-phosphate transport system substrate-binding protein